MKSSQPQFVLARFLRSREPAVALPDALWPATLVGIRGEELDGAAAGDRRTVPVAADFLPDPVPDRPQDLLRGVLATRPAALRAGVPVAGRGGAADQTIDWQLRLPVQRAAVRQRLALFPQGRVFLDRVLPDARLSDGLCHLAFAADATQRAAAAHHPAVLDLVPAARLCLDRPAENRRPHQPGVVQVARHRGRAARDDEHQLRGLHRHRLFLPAVHDPAAVLQPRETRQHVAGGGAGPRRRPDQVFPARDAAAVVSRDRRRLAAGIHPGRGRIRDSFAARPHRPAHGGQTSGG